MQRRATLKDIARAAGVHLSTVSRALNPRTQNLLTSEVVERIYKISRELDYSPNAAARSLRTNRTRTIGIVVPDITNPVFPPIIRGIEDAAGDAGLPRDRGEYRQSPEQGGGDSASVARPRR